MNPITKPIPEKIIVRTFLLGENINKPKRLPIHAINKPEKHQTIYDLYSLPKVNSFEVY